MTIQPDTKDPSMNENRFVQRRAEGYDSVSDPRAEDLMAVADEWHVARAKAEAARKRLRAKIFAFHADGYATSEIDTASMLGVTRGMVRGALGKPKRGGSTQADQTGDITDG